MKYCPKCEKEYSGSWTICLACGGALITREVEGTQPLSITDLIDTKPPVPPTDGKPGSETSSPKLDMPSEDSWDIKPDTQSKPKAAETKPGAAEVKAAETKPAQTRPVQTRPAQTSETPAGADPNIDADPLDEPSFQILGSIMPPPPPGAGAAEALSSALAAAQPSSTEAEPLPPIPSPPVADDPGADRPVTAHGSVLAPRKPNIVPSIVAVGVVLVVAAALYYFMFATKNGTESPALDAARPDTATAAHVASPDTAPAPLEATPDQASAPVVPDAAVRVTPPLHTLPGKKALTPKKVAPKKVTPKRVTPKRVTPKKVTPRPRPRPKNIQKKTINPFDE